MKLEFHGSKITSDAGLLAYRELDDALGLTEMAEGVFQDSRTGKNGWHGMTGQFHQSVFGRLGGYDDVNDADRLGRDPAMRWIVGGKAIERQAASTSQMGRFETELLATDENVEALVDMNGVWIDKVHDRHPPKMIILDMDSSVSPTHGEQEGTAYNGHFVCTCYHPDGEEERIKRLGAYVDDRVAELVESVGNVGDLRLMVMASLVLCDKLFYNHRGTADAGAEIDRLGATAAKVKKATAPEPDAAVAPVMEAIARRIEDIADHLESTHLHEFGWYMGNVG